MFSSWRFWFEVSKCCKTFSTLIDALGWGTWRQWIFVCLVLLEFAFGWLCHAKIIMRGGYTQGFWDLTIITCFSSTFVAMDGDVWQDYLTPSTTGPVWKLKNEIHVVSYGKCYLSTDSTQTCVLIWVAIINGEFSVSLPFICNLCSMVCSNTPLAIQSQYSFVVIAHGSQNWFMLHCVTAFVE